MVRVIASLDDLHFTDDGTRVEADKTHVLIYDGQAVEIDLTDEHDKELQGVLARYFAAGRRPTAESGLMGRGRHGALSPPTTSTTGTRGNMTGRSRAETKAAREWGRAEGLAHLFTTPAGSTFYKREFVDKWDAHKRQAGLTFE